MKDFTRKTIFVRRPLGVDSIQGLLELSTWYNDNKYLYLGFPDNNDTLIVPLRQLEKEGYVIIKISKDERGLDTLDEINLTISGYKLLSELREKSAMGKLKKRIGDLAWIIATTIVTTVVVLWIKGK